MDHPSPHLYRQAGLAAGAEKAVLDRALEQMARNEVCNASPIVSLKHLAHLTGAPYLYLRDIVSRAVDPYVDIITPKRSGGRRRISAPEPGLMDVQRVILKRALSRIPQHPSSFAYRQGMSIVECARRHLGAKWLVKRDLHDFFGSISERRVYPVFRGGGYSSLMSLELTRLCTRTFFSETRKFGQTRYTTIPSYAVNTIGYLPQGGPASGALANAVATSMDYALAELAQEWSLVYTRYSDDLVFSAGQGFNRTKAARFVGAATRIVGAQGFTLHEKKTRVVPPGARHIVLGLLVDGDVVRLVPEFRRRIQVHIRGVDKFGLRPHATHRGFRSLFSFVSHVDGCLPFAMSVEPEWARETSNTWRQILDARGFPVA